MSQCKQCGNPAAIGKTGQPTMYCSKQCKWKFNASKYGRKAEKLDPTCHWCGGPTEHHNRHYCSDKCLKAGRADEEQGRKRAWAKMREFEGRQYLQDTIEAKYIRSATPYAATLTEAWNRVVKES